MINLSRRFLITGDAFDASLAIVDAQTDEIYPMLAERLRLAGLISHPLRPYNDAALFPVLKWDARG